MFRVETYSGGEMLLLRHLGQNIKQRRKKLGINQMQLANNIGVSRSFIANVERGARSINVKLLHKIARVLDTTIEDLLGDDGDVAATTFGQDTLDELESMCDMLQFKEALHLIHNVDKAVYFQEPKHRQRLLLYKAKAYNGKMDYAKSIETCTHILNNCKISDKMYVADVHNTITKAYLSLGQMEQAHQHSIEAYNLICRKTMTQANKKLYRSVLLNLGMVLTHMGNLKEATQHLQKASESLNRDIHQGIKQYANTLFTMAYVEFQQQNYDKAIELCKDALRYYEFIGDVTGQLETINNIGEAYKHIDVEQSKAYFDKCYELVCQHPEFLSPLLKRSLQGEGYDI